MVWTLAAGMALAAVAWITTVVVWTALAQVRFHAFHRRERLSYPSLGLGGWVHFYVHTVASVGSLFVWWLRSAFGGSPATAGGPSASTPRGAALCIHGFHLGESSVWGLRRALERWGRRTAGLFLDLPYRSAARMPTRQLSSGAWASCWRGRPKPGWTWWPTPWAAWCCARRSPSLRSWRDASVAW